ncbi:MAG TPA: HIT family protein [Kiloniellaceae bacterium]|nr:HIT family protein [Kiloniellaceae bacterium]
MTLSSQPPAANPTMAKFGYPETLIHDYAHWAVLLRPQQATLGALVLACKDPAQAFGDISPAAFAELSRVIGDIEAGLRTFRPYQKINYLMLMMVDPDVHFHVIPRYEGARERDGRAFADAGWPGPPNLASHVALSEDEAAALAADFASRWRV